jgi:D-sedoheptulose 7-phosphate isomerase
MNPACELRRELRHALTVASYSATYLAAVNQIAAGIDPASIDQMVGLLCDVRDRGGRVFFLGVGGGATHASHAVNDLRKIAGIESYSPSDNVAELTARINDDGWASCYANWLRGSHLRKRDMVFVFSVGGGDVERNISTNIVRGLVFATEVGAKIAGIVGPRGGATAALADVAIRIPVEAPDMVTALTESFQGVIWHAIVSHPDLRVNEMKWESTR